MSGELLQDKYPLFCSVMTVSLFLIISYLADFPPGFNIYLDKAMT